MRHAKRAGPTAMPATKVARLDECEASALIEARSLSITNKEVRSGKCEGDVPWVEQQVQGNIQVQVSTTGVEMGTELLVEIEALTVPADSAIAAGLANAWRNLAEVSSYAVFAKPPSARSLSALVQSLGGGQGKASFKNFMLGEATLHDLTVATGSKAAELWYRFRVTCAAHPTLNDVSHPFQIISRWRPKTEAKAEPTGAATAAAAGGFDKLKAKIKAEVKAEMQPQIDALQRQVDELKQLVLGGNTAPRADRVDELTRLLGAARDDGTATSSGALGSLFTFPQAPRPAMWGELDQDDALKLSDIADDFDVACGGAKRDPTDAADPADPLATPFFTPKGLSDEMFLPYSRAEVPAAPHASPGLSEFTSRGLSDDSDDERGGNFIKTEPAALKPAKPKPTRRTQAASKGLVQKKELGGRSAAEAATRAAPAAAAPAPPAAAKPDLECQVSGSRTWAERDAELRETAVLVEE